MSAPANELQAAIYGILQADADLTAIVGDRIFDRVPKAGDVPPYVTFGPADEVNNDADCIDAADHALQIDVWSEKQGGFKEAKEIAFLIKRAVHEVEFDLPTHALVEMRVTIIRYVRDQDGLSSRAIISVEAMVEER